MHQCVQIESLEIQRIEKICIHIDFMGFDFKTWRRVRRASEVTLLSPRIMSFDKTPTYALGIQARCENHYSYQGRHAKFTGISYVNFDRLTRVAQHPLHLEETIRLDSSRNAQCYQDKSDDLIEVQLHVVSTLR